MSGDAGSIASRWPTGKVQEEALRVTPRVDRANSSAASRSLRPRAGPVGSLLFAHHNSSWQLGFEHERELQAVAAERFAEPLVGERDTSHVVQGGDWDATPDAASLRCWRGLQSLGGTSVCYQDARESVHPGTAGTRSRRATRW